MRARCFSASKGFAVLRFNNPTCMTNRQGVLRNNCGCACRAPFPTPPPQAGEGGQRLRRRGSKSNEIHPLLAQGASRHRGDRSIEIVERLTMIGLEVESVDDKVKRWRPLSSPRWSTASSIPTPTGCASAWSIPATASPVQVVCGAPNARAGMNGVFVPPGAYHPGQRHHAAGRHHPRRREPRHAGVGTRAGTLRRSRRHHRPAGRRAGRRRASPQYKGLDDPVIDINLTPNRPDCDRRQRHRARSCRGRRRRVRGAHAECRSRAIPLPGHR